MKIRLFLILFFCVITLSKPHKRSHKKQHKRARKQAEIKHKIKIMVSHRKTNKVKRKVRQRKRNKRKRYRKLKLSLLKQLMKKQARMAMLPGGAGGGGGGSVKAGSVTVDFPPLPEPNKNPINITTPAASYPTVVADPAKQKPIVFVPELIYPHKVKRILVHHDRPFGGFYKNMMYNLNPYWAKYAQSNPYYKNFVTGSKGFQSYLASKAYTDHQALVDKSVIMPPNVLAMEEQMAAQEKAAAEGEGGGGEGEGGGGAGGMASGLAGGIMRMVI